MAEHLKYPIRTVARMTGLGIDTLRAWERRYEAVTPTRDHRGRMYSDADVRRLKLLREATTKGHAIGRIVHLNDEQLMQAATADQPTTRPTTEPTTASRSGILGPDALADAVERFDGAFIEAELGRAASLSGPRALLQDTLIPALDEIGRRWHDGRATIAHEHLLSSIVRNILGTLMRTYSKTDTPARLVFATPAGEQHELGALGAAMLAASGGLGVVYLGPNLPAQDIVQLTRSLDTDVVVLGVTATGDDRSLIERSVQTVAAELPRDIELWLGGPAATRLAALVGPRAVALGTYEALSQQLERLGARF